MKPEPEPRSVTKEVAQTMHMTWIGSVFVLEESGSAFPNCIDCIYVNFGKNPLFITKGWSNNHQWLLNIGTLEKKNGWLEVIKLE